MSKKEKDLTRFIKDNCANWDNHYQSCLFADSCKVFDGQRCGYFEKAVLGPPDYKYKIAGYDYAKLFAQYAEQTGARKQKVKVRRCACGAALTKLRQKLCDRCKKKNRKKTKREYQRNYRKQHRVSA